MSKKGNKFRLLTQNRNNNTLKSKKSTHKLKTIHKQPLYTEKTFKEESQTRGSFKPKRNSSKPIKRYLIWRSKRQNITHTSAHRFLLNLSFRHFYKRQGSICLYRIQSILRDFVRKEGMNTNGDTFYGIIALITRGSIKRGKVCIIHYLLFSKLNHEIISPNSKNPQRSDWNKLNFILNYKQINYF